MRENPYREDREELKELLRQYQNLKNGRTHSFIEEDAFERIIDHFDEKLSFEQAIQECLHHNYQLARRQIMWFKTNIAINWFSIDCISSDELFSQAERLIDAKSRQ